MNKVRVKLTQVAHNFKKENYTAVGGVTIALTKGGKGTSAATTTWKTATLELVEVAGDKDKTTSERVLLKLGGLIREQNGSPFFTTGNADTTQFVLPAPVVMFRRAESDFIIDLNWNKATLQVGGVESLRFPWESSEEDKVQELRARLTIETTIEADVPDNDRLNIKMEHNDVPEDGLSGGALSKCVGIGTVYPEKNNNMTDTQTVPFTGKTMNVFIHKDIGAAVNALAANEYDFTKLTAALKDILASGGFTTVNIAEVDWTTPGLLAIGSVTGAPPNQQLALNGRNIPYFDSWILLDRATAWTADMEAARSESATFQLAAATKVLTSPIMILNGALANFIPTIAAGTRNIYLANLFAHEIGHGLGLNHGLDVDVAKGTYSKATGSGTMTSPLIDGNKVFLQRFGPVHRDVLKKHYVL